VEKMKSLVGENDKDEGVGWFLLVLQEADDKGKMFPSAFGMW
jgi:hypothetical protein